MKKYIPVLLSLVVAVAMSCATVRSSGSDAEGDEKIKETIEDIRKKEAQARKERKERQEREEAEEEDWWRQDPGEDDRDYGGCDGEEGGSGFFAWLEHAIAVRFAAYPYAPELPYAFTTCALDYPDETKFYALQVESSGAYHFDGTYGNLNRLTVQVAGFHFNLVQHSFFATSERFSLLSVNAGGSLGLPDFLLSAYAGAYWLDILDGPLPSFGFSSQLFFPGGFYLDLYNLNALLAGCTMHFHGSLNFAVWRFGFAVGYTYNNFAGNVFHGPSLGISFWL